MRRFTLMAGTLLASASIAFADAGHSHKNHTQADHKTVQSAGEHGHTEGHDHDAHHAMMDVGMPGKADAVDRTVTVTMRETDDGEMLFEPASFDFATGETIRFEITNPGELGHEFVLDTVEGNARHKAMMATMTMEHNDPNAVQLEPGERGEVIWTFANAGTFEFACLIPGHYESGMHGPITVAGEANAHVTTGTVTKVDVGTGRVTINHGPMPHLGMPAMVMMFHADADILGQLSEGQNIEFVAQSVDGKLTVTDLK